MKWLLGEREGYGCIMETMGIPGLSVRRGRWFSDRQPAISAG